MMKAGADPHLKDRLGNPLLHVAMEAGRRDLVDRPHRTRSGLRGHQRRRGNHPPDRLPPRLAGLHPQTRRRRCGPERPGRRWTHPAGPGRRRQEIRTKSDCSSKSEPTRIAVRFRREPRLRWSGFSRSGDLALFQVFLDHGVKPPEGNWNAWLWTGAMNAVISKPPGCSCARARRPSFPVPDGLLLVEAAALDGRRIVRQNAHRLWKSNRKRPSPGHRPG